MKKAAVRLVYTLAYYSGILGLLIRFNKRPIIVTYHNVLEDRLYEGASHLTLTHGASLFDRQIAIIRQKFSVSDDLEPGSVHVTFDDGYRNNETVALPIMQKHGITGTFFVPAGYFDGIGTLWVDRLLMWLAHVPSGDYDVLGRRLSIHSAADRQRGLDELYRGIIEDYAMKGRLLEALDETYKFAELEIETRFREQRYEPLDLAGISALIDAGCRVACHSYQHDVLACLSDEQLEEDFQRCLAHRGRYNSGWFAYPFGRPEEVDARVVEKCKASGYSRAFINRNTRTGDSHQIPRINMPDSDDKLLIYAKLSGFEAWLKSLLPG